MADFADIASEREQIDTARAIEAARRPTSPGPIACGQCHNCDASVLPGHAFCDADCRDDWEKRKRAGL